MNPKKSLIQKEAEAKGVLERFDTAQLNQAQTESLLQMGAVAALKKIAQGFSAQTIRALDSMKEDKIHENFGFTRFDDFLDQYPYSPLSSAKYYRQRALLEQEGEDTYNLFNQLALPASTRRQLPAGTITIEADAVIIGSERVPITEADRIKQILRDQADANIRLTKNLDEGRKQYTQIKKQLAAANAYSETLQEKLEEAKRNPAAADSGSPLEAALGQLFLTAGQVEAEARRLSPGELESLKPQILREWSRADTRLKYALGLISEQDFLLADILNTPT